MFVSACRSGNYPQRAHAREIAVMRHQGGGVDRQRARRLNGVGQLEAERSPQSCSIFSDADVEVDRMPRFEDGPVTPCERVVGCLQGTGQHLGDRDGRDGKAQAPSRMGFEKRPEARPCLGCPSIGA